MAFTFVKTLYGTEIGASEKLFDAEGAKTVKVSVSACLVCAFVCAFVRAFVRMCVCVCVFV